jgi:hypothetical protein
MDVAGERRASWPCPAPPRGVLLQADPIVGGLGGRHAHSPFSYDFGRPAVFRVRWMLRRHPERSLPFRVWLHVTDGRLHLTAITSVSARPGRRPQLERTLDEALAPVLAALGEAFPG